MSGPILRHNFGNVCLAEAHNFGIALATGREVAAAFGTAHGECGEGVFESLLEGEEFEDRKIYG